VTKAEIRGSTSEELEKKSIDVILAEYDMIMAFGSGPRCLTRMLRRDP